MNEFKQMVKNLHDQGIEVILDVVYNHTAEGNHMGPVLCFRGIDNAAYYRLVPDKGLNMRHPHVLQLIMDSLRYWILAPRQGRRVPGSLSHTATRRTDRYLGRGAHGEDYS